MSDQYVWPYTTNLEYTVKSGYWTATHDFMDENPIIPPEGSLVLKAQIWKLEILPKIQRFLLKSISLSIPTLFIFALVLLILILFFRYSFWRNIQSIMFCFPSLMHKLH